jgi:hypothetical protein
MGTTSEELKRLYIKLGGREEAIQKASTPGEIINGINELPFSPGGGDIPIYDPVKDEGKVLCILNGIPTWSTVIPGYRKED